MTYASMTDSTLISFTAQRALEVICKSFVHLANDNELEYKKAFNLIYDDLFSLLSYSTPTFNVIISLISNLLRDFRKYPKVNAEMNPKEKMYIQYSCDSLIIAKIEKFIFLFVQQIIGEVNQDYEHKICFQKLVIQLVKYFNELQLAPSEEMIYFLSKYIRHATIDVFLNNGSNISIDINSVLLLQKTLLDLLNVSYNLFVNQYIYCIQFLKIINGVIKDILICDYNCVDPFHINPVDIKRAFVLWALKILELVLNKASKHWRIQENQTNITFTSDDVYHLCSNLSVDDMNWKSNHTELYENENDVGNEILSTLILLANNLYSFKDVNDMNVLIDYFIEQDDQLIELLHILQTIYQRFDQTNHPSLLYYIISTHQDIIMYVKPLVDPHIVFFRFLQKIHFDYSVLLDFLVSNETNFLFYFLTYLKICKSNYNQMVTSLRTISPYGEERAIKDDIATKNLNDALEKLSLLDLNSDSEPINLIEGYDDFEDEYETLMDPIEGVLNVIVQLRIRLENAEKKKLLPHKISPLINQLIYIENMYEESGEVGD